jgi:hypothetical protein
MHKKHTLIMVIIYSTLAPPLVVALGRILYDLFVASKFIPRERFVDFTVMTVSMFLVTMSLLSVIGLSQMILSIKDKIVLRIKKD